MVVHHGHGWLVEEGEEGAGKHQNHEAVESDLAEHEAPVVGEHLAAEVLENRSDWNALVDVVRGPCEEPALFLCNSAHLVVPNVPECWAYGLKEVALCD